MEQLFCAVELQSFGMTYIKDVYKSRLGTPPHHNMHKYFRLFKSKNKKMQDIPATLTFSEFVALGVTVLVLLVRLPPVPL